MAVAVTVIFRAVKVAQGPDETLPSTTSTVGPRVLFMIKLIAILIR